jgi:plasmid maintenance system killer protein
MFDILFQSVPTLVMLILFFWYLRMAQRTLSLQAGHHSPLQRQIDVVSEAQRTGRLVSALAATHEARLKNLETGVTG